MIPKLPESLTADDLRALYRASDGSCTAYDLEAGDPEGWERVRRYAYVRYWNERFDEGHPVSRSEIEEWKQFISLPFICNVAWGIIGDAARRNLLPAEALPELESMTAVTDYAKKQLRGRSLLVQSARVDAALVDALLESKAHWALHELLQRKLEPDELRIIETAAGDKRLSRIERHSLREAIRKRAVR